MAASGSNDQRAAELLAKAEKHLKKSFLHSPDHQAAAELFEKASNLYKLDKAWNKAGDALVRAGNCEQELGSVMGAARHYTNAAVAFKNGGNGPSAVASYKRAAALYIEEGKFSQAGKQMRDLSELEESMGLFSEAYASISTAIEYLETANEPLGAAQLKNRAAQQAMEAGALEDASDLYEAVALKVSIPSTGVGPFFLAALCRLALGDTVATSKKLDTYGSMNRDFLASEELVFVHDLINAVETMDYDAVTTAISKYDPRNKKLDPAKKRLIAKIAEAIPKEENDDQIL